MEGYSKNNVGCKYCMKGDINQINLVTVFYYSVVEDRENGEKGQGKRERRGIDKEQVDV